MPDQTEPKTTAKAAKAAKVPAAKLLSASESGDVRVHNLLAQRAAAAAAGDKDAAKQATDALADLGYA